MIGLRSFRIHDPRKPSLLNDHWLRFDAEAVVLEVECETDGVPPYTASAHIETRRLKTAPYEILATSTVAAIGGTTMSFSFASVPQWRRQERPSLRQSHFGFGGLVPFSYGYRFRVELSDAHSVIGEAIIPFAVDRLPIAIDFIHVYDPAAPTPIPDRPEHQRVPNRPSALAVHVRCTTSLTAVECTLRIKDRDQFDATIATATRTLTTTGTIDEEFVFSPVPQWVHPPEGDHDQYLVDFEFRSQGGTVSALASFGLEYQPPIGAIAILHAAVNRHPIYEPAEAPGLLDDEMERVIFTVLVQADGYDAREDLGRAWVNATVYDADGISRFFSSSDFFFGDDNTAWVFLEVPNPPALPTAENKRLYISAHHGARRSDLELAIPYHARFRIDRSPEILRSRWNTGGGPATRQWFQSAPSLSLEMIGYYHPAMSAISVALAVLPRSRSGIRLTPDSTRVVGFSSLHPVPSDRPLPNTVVVEFPPFPEELFEFDSIAIYGALQYSFQGVRYARALELGEEPLPESPALLVHSTSMSRRASPGRVVVVPAPSLPPERLSGAHWCARFPTETSINALVEPFRGNLTRFRAMLESNGASVTINATRRPAERAHLMHYAFRIARMGFNPGAVPTRAGVDIIWSHPRAVAAAEDMVRTYQIVYQPALHSLHTDGRAVDMVVRNLPATIQVQGPAGPVSVRIGSQAAEANVNLWRVADRYFQISKSPSDWVHWSDKG